MCTFEELRDLTEDEARQNLANNPVTIEVANIYSEALVTRNAVIAVAAQEELAKREKYNLIGERFKAACQTVGIKLGTDFSNQLAQSFLQMGASEPWTRTFLVADNTVGLDGIKYEANDEINELIRRLINSPQTNT